jgi:hypothetical protein
MNRLHVITVLCAPFVTTTESVTADKNIGLRTVCRIQPVEATSPDGRRPLTGPLEWLAVRPGGPA